MPPNTPVVREDDSRSGSGMSWKEVLLVTVFGACGGLLSWIAAVVAADVTPDLVRSPVLHLHWYGAVPASIALGMGAAYLGVYVVANSDPRSLPRFLGFALICGFAWAPVFDMAKTLIKQPEQQRNTEAQVKTIQNLASPRGNPPDSTSFSDKSN